MAARTSRLLRLPLACVLVMLACTPPGKGPKANRGYARATPVIGALERFRAERGTYPESLRELVPDYMRAEALATPEHRHERYPWEYRRTSEGYELAFRYVGPGMNRCIYAPAAGWRCSGYY